MDRKRGANYIFVLYNGGKGFPFAFLTRFSYRSVFFSSSRNPDQADSGLFIRAQLWWILWSFPAFLSTCGRNQHFTRTTEEKWYACWVSKQHQQERMCPSTFSLKPEDNNAAFTEREKSSFGILKFRQNYSGHKNATRSPQNTQKVYPYNYHHIFVS